MRILVLQEIEGNLNRIHLALDPLGFEIIPFKSQPLAMEYLNSHRVDMIVSAVHLQSGNVFDFLKWVKGDRLNSSAKFVFFCAEPTELAKYVWPAVQTAAMTLGADRYIAMENFNEQELRLSLKDVMAIGKQRQRVYLSRGLGQSDEHNHNHNNGHNHDHNQAHNHNYDSGHDG